jgi:hypothetical protein
MLLMIDSVKPKEYGRDGPSFILPEEKLPMFYRFALLCVVFISMTACRSASSGAAGSLAIPTPTPVHIYFSHRPTEALSEPQPVLRHVPVASKVEDTLRATLESLLFGPTTRERAMGLDSWFSHKTASIRVAVAVTAEGTAVINFEDFSALIPNASTSAGSRDLLAQLNATVFQFQDVAAVEYQFDSSCEAFWNWLQSDCQRITRQQWQNRPTS